VTISFLYAVVGNDHRARCRLALGVAWTLLIRTAIACSDARGLIPNSEKGVWFQWHRGINLVVGIVLTVVLGIAIAVYIIQGRTKRLGGTFFEAAAAPPNRPRRRVDIGWRRSMPRAACSVPPAPSRTRRNASHGRRRRRGAGRSRPTTSRRRSVPQCHRPNPRPVSRRWMTDTGCFLGSGHHSFVWRGVQRYEMDYYLIVGSKENQTRPTTA
jgi:hypothetical protein